MQITITLPDNLFAYLQSQVALGHYATPTDYIQALIQADLTHKANLEAKLLEALDSPATPMTSADWDHIYATHQNPKHITAHQRPQPARQAGSLEGMITMAPDFDAPLEDLKDYM